MEAQLPIDPHSSIPTRWMMDVRPRPRRGYVAASSRLCRGFVEVLSETGSFVACAVR